MRGPSLQWTTGLSGALHITFVLMASLFFNNSREVTIPSPYEVSLVGLSTSSQAGAPAEKITVEQPETKVAEVAQANNSDMDRIDRNADSKRLEDRIAALAAKKKAERSVKKSETITVGRRTAPSITRPVQGTDVGSGVPGSGTYEDLIAQRIGQEIEFPETGETQLVTVILVKIRKDGEVTIQGIEKRSGNERFDRVALRAIEKASPVPPPPAEMEIGLRLHPYGAKR